MKTNDDHLLRCPDCGFIGDLDAFDVIGADDGCLFCNQCGEEFDSDANTLPPGVRREQFEGDAT